MFAPLLFLGMISFLRVLLRSSCAGIHCPDLASTNRDVLLSCSQRWWKETQSQCLLILQILQPHPKQFQCDFSCLRLHFLTDNLDNNKLHLCGLIRISVRILLLFFFLHLLFYFLEALSELTKVGWVIRHGSDSLLNGSGYEFNNKTRNHKKKKIFVLYKYYWSSLIFSHTSIIAGCTNSFSFGLLSHPKLPHKITGSSPKESLQISPTQADG